MNNNEIIKSLTDTVQSLTRVIDVLSENSRLQKQQPVQVDFDNIDKINDPFGMKPNIKEVEKIVEVIKEVQVEVEKIVEVPFEVIKEVEVIKEIEKKIYIAPDLTEFNSIEEVQDYIKSLQKPIKEIKKENKEIVKPKPKSVDFPENLFHNSGAELEKMLNIDDYIYKPSYILSSNQCVYGVKGEWSVVVEYKENKYITEHPQEHFNGVELKEFKDDI